MTRPAPDLEHLSERHLRRVLVEACAIRARRAVAKAERAMDLAIALRDYAEELAQEANAFASLAEEGAAIVAQDRDGAALERAAREIPLETRLAKRRAA